MAPEISKHLGSRTMPVEHQDTALNKNQDVFSLGLILYELNYKVKTMMQKIEVFRDLKMTRKLKSQWCPLVLGKHIEYELILKMTEENASRRPSAQEIKELWLPRWAA